MQLHDFLFLAGSEKCGGDPNNNHIFFIFFPFNPPHARNAHDSRVCFVSLLFSFSSFSAFWGAASIRVVSNLIRKKKTPKSSSSLSSIKTSMWVILASSLGINRRHYRRKIQSDGEKEMKKIKISTSREVVTFTPDLLMAVGGVVVIVVLLLSIQEEEEHSI